MVEHTPANLADLTPEEAEAAHALAAKGFAIVDFSTEPAGETEAE